MFNGNGYSFAKVFELLVSADKITITVCETCSNELILAGKRVYILADAGACSRVEETARRLALNTVVLARAHRILQGLMLAIDGLIIAAVLVAASLLGLDPFTTGVLVAAAAVLSAIARTLASRRRERVSRATQYTASLDIVASIVGRFLEAYCTRCERYPAGYRCRLRGSTVLLKRIG